METAPTTAPRSSAGAASRTPEVGSWLYTCSAHPEGRSFRVEHPHRARSAVVALVAGTVLGRSDGTQPCVTGCVPPPKPDCAGTRGKLGCRPCHSPRRDPAYFCARVTGSDQVSTPSDDS